LFSLLLAFFFSFYPSFSLLPLPSLSGGFCSGFGSGFGSGLGGGSLRGGGDDGSSCLVGGS
jgi:hypothetical protein